MTRIGLFLACAGALAACSSSGTNPLTGPGDEPDPGTGTGGLAGTAVFAGEVNSLSYNAANDTLVINNLPFDGEDGVYTNTGIASVQGFGVYESGQTTEDGQRKYFAVFRQSASGEVSAGAVGTGDYSGFGFGGAALARSTTAVSLPTTGEAVYTGRYGGIRILDDAAGGTGDVEFVEGRVTLDVDFADFDTTGAVEGFVTNRVYYDVNGARIGTLPTIFLSTASINEDGTIGPSTAGTVDSQGDELQSGTYEGLFGGATADEIAGVIIITGPETEGADIDVQETGVFTAVD